MRIGIFFGGPSREREISFSGGKTAFEFVDKFLFQPTPIFVDSFGRFIKLNPALMYAPDIRNFYPSGSPQKSNYKLYIESYPELANEAIPEEIGVEIAPQEFLNHFDFAFLAMHGPDCEDGAIQGLLEWYKVPYSGPGLMGSALAIDKILQNDMIALVNQQQKKSWTLTHQQWVPAEYSILFQVLKKHLGLPLVIKAPHQGSSIGVAIVKEDSLEEFVQAVNQCFFQLEITATEWNSKSSLNKIEFAQKIANLNESIGYPVYVANAAVLYHPDALIAYLENYFVESQNESIIISSANAEDQVLIEEFISGQEFSCGCIQFDDGKPLALPPSEVIKLVEVFDFDSKYKAGASKKRIPVATSLAKNQEIQAVIEAVFQQLGMTACVRIDGFLTSEGTILLHDPNSIPGMSPTSFIFKQMAEIGLDVTQALTYLVRQSLRERIRLGKETWKWRLLLQELDTNIMRQQSLSKPQVAILFKGDDDQYRQARKLFGEINATGTKRALPVLETGEGQYYLLPKSMMFKDYVEDVLSLLDKPRHPLLTETSERASDLTHFYAGKVDFQLHQFSDKLAIVSIDEWIELKEEK